MFEGTLAAQGLDRDSRKFLALTAALLAHFAVVSAAAFASFWNVTMPKDHEIPLPVIFFTIEPIPVVDFFKPAAAPRPPAPPRGGGSAALRPIVKPPTIVIPTTTPASIPPPAPPTVDSFAPLGADDPGPGDGHGDKDGIPGGTGTGSPDGVGDDVGPSGPVPITAAMTPPRLLRKVEPSYPPAARIARIEGHVTIEAVIGLDGSVEAAQIVGSTSSLFDDAALDAVRQWRYTPASLNGGPVRVYLRVQVGFVLR